MNQNDFDTLVNDSVKLTQDYPGAVFIGGLAVYLYTEKRLSELVEVSHDADLYIALSDLPDLRDNEELISNKRLGKKQFSKNGMEFDVYVEQGNNLCVPYDEIYTHCQIISDVRVASIGHLIPLKLAAALSRAGSSKGQKDIRDLVKILIMSNEGDVRIAAAFIGHDELGFLDAITTSDTFRSLASGNLKTAKEYRNNYSLAMEALVEAVEAVAQRADSRPRI